MRIVGNKMLDVCADCGKIIQINKPIVGALHFCTTEEERQKYAPQIRAEAERALRKLMNARS